MSRPKEEAGGALGQQKREHIGGRGEGEEGRSSCPGGGFLSTHPSIYPYIHISVRPCKLYLYKQVSEL